ncbi:MAG: hypothetical protein Tsb0014_28650 [Pleurocapsa sp.]
MPRWEREYWWLTKESVSYIASRKFYRVILLNKILSSSIVKGIARTREFLNKLFRGFERDNEQNNIG